MSAAFRAVKDGGAPVVGLGAWAHIIVGSLVLGIALWRMMHGVPPAPVTGLLPWFGGVLSLGEIHGGILKMLMWVMLGLHVAAALWHHFIRKDGLFNRMRKPG